MMRRELAENIYMMFLIYLSMGYHNGCAQWLRIYKYVVYFFVFYCPRDKVLLLLDEIGWHDALWFN